MLRNYGLQGIFEKVNGIIIARPKDYTQREKEDLNKIILNIVGKEFKASEIPIVVNVDFGHTDPKIILPLGCMVSLSPSTKGITLLESPFRP